MTTPRERSSTASAERVRRLWARVGASFNVPPEPGPDPDLEWLLLQTARLVPGDPRLYVVVVSWLAVHSTYVARKRLRVLARTLTPDERGALGLIVDEAIRLGARKDLRQATKDCEPVSPPRPLFELYRSSPQLAGIAERQASAISRGWGLWAPAPVLKQDALRPPHWILATNPSYLWRAVRQGDLRESVLQILQRDVPGDWCGSESALAKLCGVTRPALRKALRALELEGCRFEAPERGPRRSKQLSLRQLAHDLDLV